MGWRRCNPAELNDGARSSRGLSDGCYCSNNYRELLRIPMSLPPNARRKTDGAARAARASVPRPRSPPRARPPQGLLTILKKQKQKEREVRLLMLGLDNAGKTTVVKKFNGEDIDLIPPTLGFNIETLEYRGFKLNIWDVGGQTSLRSYWRNYFEQTDGLIWVVDSADRARLHDCRAELEALLQQEVRTRRAATSAALLAANARLLPC